MTSLVENFQISRHTARFRRRYHCRPHYSISPGYMLYPLNAVDKPRFHYVLGDSVSLAVSESTNDYNSLVGCAARDAAQFYDFVPQLPPIKDEPEYKIVPLLALQLTLFPARGICVGFANHHSIGDASSIVSFIKAWASICMFDGSDDELMSQHYGKHMPCFDRTLIKDPLGMEAILWNQMRQIPVKSSTFPLPTKRVRATYILNASDVKKLKGLVLSKRPSLVHLSSFVVASAFVWVNLVKSGDVIGEEVDADMDEYFRFPADARSRTDPPVPANYFGNCLSGGTVIIRHGELVGKEGFVIAAEATSSLDEGKYVVSLFKWRDSENGLEIGLSLPKPRMAAFAGLFQDGLRSIP